MLSGRRVRAVAASVLVVAVACGCAQQVGGSPTAAGGPATSSTSAAAPSPEPEPSETSTPATGTQVDLALLQGTWRGEYQCSQGKTGLELEVGAPEGDSVPAVFKFFPLPGGAKAESGSFRMRGTNTEQGLVFRGEQWIEQPPNYSMVDLGVAAVDGGTMTGRVAGPGCGDFALTKKGTSG